MQRSTDSILQVRGHTLHVHVDMLWQVYPMPKANSQSTIAVDFLEMRQ